VLRLEAFSRLTVEAIGGRFLVLFAAKTVAMDVEVTKRTRT